MTQAKLYDATLTEANLLEANLEEADLTAADLQRTDLTRACLGRAGLERARLQKATLQNASLEGADLRDARLDGANLEGVFVREVHAPGVVLSSANLREADFAEANLRGARLDNADLEKASFLDADLAGSSQRGAKLGAEFDKVLAEHHAWMKAQGGDRAERVTAQLAAVDVPELRHAARRASEMTDAYKSTHFHLATLSADASPEAVVHEQDLARGYLKEGDDREAYEYTYHRYPNDGGVPSGTAWEDLRPAYFDAYIRNHGLIEPEPTRWERIERRVGALFSREETPAPEAEPATPAVRNERVGKQVLLFPTKTIAEDAGRVLPTSYEYEVQPARMGNQELYAVLTSPRPPASERRAGAEQAERLVEVSVFSSKDQAESHGQALASSHEYEVQPTRMGKQELYAVLTSPRARGASQEPEPATPAAPSPAPQAGRDPAEGQPLAPAQPTPTREAAQAARAQILAHPEETRAAIAQMVDPADRARAERLLAIVEHDAAARQRTPERAAAAQLDR